MKIVVIGNFRDSVNGQSIRSRNIVDLLKKTENELYVFDTGNPAILLIKLPVIAYRLTFSKRVVVMLGRNGVHTLLPIILTISKVVRTPLIFVPIGGWLDELVNRVPFLSFVFNNCHCILPQTDRLARSLYKNLTKPKILVLPNFRVINHMPFKRNEASRNSGKYFKVIFHARVTKDKGAWLLLDMAEKIEAMGITDVCFDIFGPIDPDDSAEFISKIDLLKNVFLKGSISTAKLYSILPGYNLSILPTFYPGEGFPGTVLDAYNNGVPVLTTRWLDIPSYVEEGKTGFLCEPNSLESLLNVFLKVYKEKDSLCAKKHYIKQYSKKFSYRKAEKILKVALSPDFS